MTDCLGTRVLGQKTVSRLSAKVYPAWGMLDLWAGGSSATIQVIKGQHERGLVLFEIGIAALESPSVFFPINRLREARLQISNQKTDSTQNGVIHQEVSKIMMQTIQNAEFSTRCRESYTKCAHDS